MDVNESIQAFLAGSTFAVAGASTNRAKYGNKVLRCYQQHDLEAWPINPRADEIEGATCYPDVASLPGVPHGLSIITPPAHSEGIVDAAIAAGIQHVWFQPGAEHDDAIERAEAAGVNVIAHGPCLLVALGFRE
jgi:predicted CoA-binding protein